MVQIRHSGLYVKNLEKISAFYKHVFHMYPICENVIQEDALIRDIFQGNSAKIKLTKLITEQGRECGHGDMLELIQVMHQKNMEREETVIVGKRLFDPGVIHLAFGVEHIYQTIDLLVKSDGIMETEVHDMGNGRHCCFCRDPEGNFLEIIGREH